MKPIDAIRTATINAADLLGVTDRGELVPGKLADIIGVRGDPTKDVNMSWATMIHSGMSAGGKLAVTAGMDESRRPLTDPFPEPDPF